MERGINLKRSIGLIEFKSIAKGIEATDEMLKAAEVSVILTSSLCPGKYISIIEGDVAAVKTSIAVGVSIGDVFCISHYVISNVHESIFPALTGTSTYDEIRSIGIVETMSAITSIMAGDIASKTADIDLIDVRIARGLGGKGFIVISGDVSAVKSAVTSCLDQLKDTGDIVATTVIPSPADNFKDFLV